MRSFERVEYKDISLPRFQSQAVITADPDGLKFDTKLCNSVKHAYYSSLANRASLAEKNTNFNLLQDFRFVIDRRRLPDHHCS